MVHERPRIVIVTNGNYFSHLALSPLLAATKNRYEYRVIVTTGLRKGSGNRVVEALRLSRKWGWRYTIYKSSTYVLPMLAQLFRRKPMFVHSACSATDLAFDIHSNINVPEVIDELKAFSPDLLVSFSCPYKISSRVLAIPTIGCLNVHSSLLPAYAGVCTYIHVLADGETKTGVTVHEMVERFDAGRILGQAEFDISAGSSVFGLFSRQCRMAGELLRHAIADCVKDGEIGGDPQDLSKRCYRGEPTSMDIKRLKRRGHILMSCEDIKTIFGR